MQGLIGKKVGMTQVFTADGKAEPVTVLQLGPCPVLQIKYPTPQGGAAAARRARLRDRPFARVDRDDPSGRRRDPGRERERAERRREHPTIVRDGSPPYTRAMASGSDA